MSDNYVRLFSDGTPASGWKLDAVARSTGDEMAIAKALAAKALSQGLWVDLPTGTPAEAFVHKVLHAPEHLDIPRGRLTGYSFSIGLIPVQEKDKPRAEIPQRLIDLAAYEVLRDPATRDGIARINDIHVNRETIVADDKSARGLITKWVASGAAFKVYQQGIVDSAIKEGLQALEQDAAKNIIAVWAAEAQKAVFERIVINALGATANIAGITLSSVTRPQIYELVDRATGSRHYGSKPSRALSVLVRPADPELQFSMAFIHAIPEVKIEHRPPRMPPRQRPEWVPNPLGWMDGLKPRPAAPVGAH